MMMYTKEDCQIKSIDDLLEFAPIFIFAAFVSPFIIAAYTVGFVMNALGILNDPA